MPRALPAMWLLAAAPLIAVTLGAQVIAANLSRDSSSTPCRGGSALGINIAPAGGDARFVLFQGEAMDIEIGCLQHDGRVSARRYDRDSRGQRSDLISFRDGRQKSADLVLSTTVHVRHARLGGLPVPVAWGSILDLEPDTGVTWHATLEGRGEPGIYRWQIMPSMRTSVPLSINSSVLDYELRPVTTFADRAELLRRKMVLARISTRTRRQNERRQTYWPSTPRATRRM